MVQNQSEQLLKLLEPTFGSASELSEELGNAALEVAVTPLADITDYTAIQKAVWVMLEIKKALDKVAEQKKLNYQTRTKGIGFKPTPFLFTHYFPLS